MFVKYSNYEKGCRLKDKHVLNLKDVSIIFKDTYETYIFSEPVSLLNISALFFSLLPVNWKMYLTVAVICRILVSSVSLLCQVSCIYTSVYHLFSFINYFINLLCSLMKKIDILGIIEDIVSSDISVFKNHTKILI